MAESAEQYLIAKDTLTDIADAVRWRTGKPGNLSPANMAGRLNESYFMHQRTRQYDYNDDEIEEWIRPEDWPDLDSIAPPFEGDEDWILMTYDADQEVSAICWYLTKPNNGKAITIEIGHIEDEAFIADETSSVTATTYTYTRWLDDFHGKIVVRISGIITRCTTTNATRKDASGANQTQTLLQQPLLERIVYAPNITTFGTNSSNTFSSYHLQRDKVNNGDGHALTTVSCMYCECQNLQSIDLTGLRTPNVTSMSSMFSGCYSLKGILDLKHFDTQKVTSFSAMFNSCRRLKQIDLRGWNTANVTTLTSMFYDCRDVQYIYGLNEFNTSKVTNMSYVFYYCRAIEDLHGVENWDTSSVTTIYNMFTNCESVESLDLHLWNVSKITSFGGTFSSCVSLKYLDISGWTPGELTTISNCFNTCKSLQYIDINNWMITNKCTNIGSLFNACWSIKEIHIPEGWDVSGLSGNYAGSSIFSNCYNVREITGISNWHFVWNSSQTSTFSNCYCLKSLDVSGWGMENCTNVSSMFNTCYSLEDLNISGWNISNKCTNISSMFNDCFSLKNITGIDNMENWDTSNVTNFSSIFDDCTSLKIIPDVSKWDYSSATSIYHMFYGAGTLESLEINGVNMPNVTDIREVFRYCYNLQKLKIVNLNIPKVTQASGFAADCRGLRDIFIDSPIQVQHGYTGDLCLSHESVIRILNSLPVVTKQTLNLGTMHINRLTSEEKAIATEKGWTLAN